MLKSGKFQQYMYDCLADLPKNWSLLLLTYGNTCTCTCSVRRSSATYSCIRVVKKLSWLGQETLHRQGKSVRQTRQSLRYMHGLCNGVLKVHQYLALCYTKKCCNFFQRIIQIRTQNPTKLHVGLDGLYRFCTRHFKVLGTLWSHTFRIKWGSTVPLQW